MNRFADIIRRTVGKDSEGFKTETETVLVYAVRCCHEARHPSRRWVNLAAFSEATDRFVLRTIPGVIVVSGDFIDCDGVRYKVESAEPVRGMYVEIYAERVVSAFG